MADIYGYMIDPLAIVSLIISLICLLLTLYLSKRVKEGVFNRLNELQEEFGVILKPIIDTNSRAMGAISSLSDDTKMDQTLERRIGQDLMSQNEDILEVIQMAFPRVAEYIEERPEAISKLMPRLNQLLQDPEARKRLNLDNSQFRGTDLKRFRDWE